jgi:prepilin-type processing-associated H-X9-DG protein
VGNSGGLYGWTMGSAHAFNADQTNFNDGRHFNCTSVRYLINQRGLANSAANGTNNDVGTNFPLSSAHPGGANMCFADGSARLFPSTTTAAVIHALCTRANGETVSAN